MLRFRFRSIRSSALICTAAIALMGCEHQESREQADTEAALRNAEAKLLSAGSDTDKLKQAVSTIQNIRGGSKQQQANRDLMLAAAEIRFGQSQIQTLNTLELNLRNDTEHVRALVDGVQDLQSFIEARKINLSELGHDDLQKQNDDLTTTISALRRQLADMQAPVQAIRTQNEDQGSRVLDLRRAADSLRQEQMELGPLEGFEVFKRAIVAEDEANLLELEIAQRQVVMELDTQPLIDQTTLAKEHVQGHIEEVTSAQQALIKVVDSNREQAESARRLIDTMNSSINTAMRSLNEQQTTALQATYDSIRSTFEKAASSARSGQRAINKDAKGPASLLQSQSNMLVFQTDAQMLRGLQQRIMLLERLSSSDVFSNRDTYAQQLAQAKQQFDMMKQGAQAAGEAAIQALSGVRNGAVDQLRNELQSAMSMSGFTTAQNANAPVTQTAPPAPAPTPPAPAPATAGGDTFATPEALVEYINSLAASDESTEDKIKAINVISLVTSPDAKEADRMQLQLLKAFNNLVETATRKFGSASSMMIGQIQAQIDNSVSRMDLDTLKMTSDTTAEISIDQPMGTPVTGYLIKTPARGWLLNQDENLARTPMLKQGMQMLPMLIKAFNEVADKIQAGEITNPMGIDMAIGQAMGGGG